MRSVSGITFIVHAYHHVVADVVEILGHKHVRVGPGRWIYSSELDWTRFFRDGFTKANTTFHVFPPGDFTYIAKFEFLHKLPGEK